MATRDRRSLVLRLPTFSGTAVLMVDFSLSACASVAGAPELRLGACRAQRDAAPVLAGAAEAMTGRQGDRVLLAVEGVLDVGTLALLPRQVPFEVLRRDLPADVLDLGGLEPGGEVL